MAITDWFGRFGISFVNVLRALEILWNPFLKIYLKKLWNEAEKWELIELE
jgi:hypothetical protein